MANEIYTIQIKEPFDKVKNALTSKEYWEFDAEKLTPVAGKVTSFERLENKVTIEILNEVPTDALPDVVKKFISGNINVKRDIVFESSNEYFSTATELKGKLGIDLGKLPVNSSGVITVKPDPEKADYTLFVGDVDLNVNIPIIGKKVEAKAAPAVNKILDRETELMSQWIAQNL